MSTTGDSDGKVSCTLLKSLSGEFDLESIHALSLRNLDLNDLGSLGKCTSLGRLDLSRNDITRLHPLAELVNLTYLNLSANRISSLEGLQSVENLECLNLSGNLIGSFDSLRALTQLSKLSDLRLRDAARDLTNPVCMNTNYRSAVTSVFPTLVKLDGERVTGKGSEVYKMFSEIDQSLAVAENQSNQLAVMSPANKWFPEGFWEKSDRSFENSSLHDAEKQLTDLLSSCKKISNDAAQVVQESRTRLDLS